MGLERRGNGLYFYKKVRNGDRVVSRYAGSGYAAIAMEGLSQIDSKELKQRSELVRAEQKEISELNHQMSQFLREVDQILASSLESAGYHRHKRGEWRKKRTT